jgi:hypothetical protein
MSLSSKRSFLLAPLSLVLGCLGGAAEPLDDDGDTGSEALSAYSDTLVTLRRDTRRCASPYCGGWHVRDVNRSTGEQYVSALDFTRSGFDEATRRDVLDAPDGDVIVRGRLGPLDVATRTRTLRVAEAWRALPRVTPREGDVVYRVDRQAFCVGTPCYSWRATRVNVGTFAGFNELLASSLGVPVFFDHAWALDEVLRRGSLVAGRVQPWPVVPFYTVLDASQVYLKLPQQPRCVAHPVPVCPRGMVPAWERGLDRCLIPRGCVRPGMCEPVQVECPDGYVARSWMGTSGCTQTVCDPAFTR